MHVNVGLHDKTLIIINKKISTVQRFEYYVGLL